MSRRNEKNRVFMNIAKEVASLSRAKRLKVGSVLMRDDRIISIGYNGTPSGLDNDCEISVCTLGDFCNCDDLPNCANLVSKTPDSVIHAEMNAILFAAKHGIKTDGCKLFVTAAPCFSCSRAIIQAGIVEVYFSEDYHTAGISLLESAGVNVFRI